MPKKTELAAKPKETAIQSWDEQLAKYAENVSSKEIAPAGNFISVRGGQLSFAGQPIAGNKMDVIVLDSVMENAYYTGDFDPDKPQPPACYAFGRDEATMKPHEEAAEPQSDTCANCQWNKWGTAERGKGKACKNIRRLALLSTSGLTKDNLLDQEEAYLKVSVTSVKGWAMYVKGLNNSVSRPPFAVVTKIGVVPDPKTQHRITFEYVDKVPDDLLPGLLKRYNEMEKSGKIMFPYPKAAAEEPAPELVGKAKKVRKF